MKLMAARLGMPIYEFYKVLARLPALQLEVLSAGNTMLTASGQEEPLRAV